MFCHFVATSDLPIHYCFQVASPFIQRYVPFAAVASANMVNVPLMRQRYVKLYVIQRV